MKLVILGILMEGDKHPYEIQQIMHKRKMSRYIKIQKGSLYYAVDQLEKNSHVEVVSVVKDSPYPNRTIYRITDKGIQEFHRLLQEQFLSSEKFYNPIHAGLAFARHADQQKIADILEVRIEKLKLALESMREAYEWMVPIVPRASLHIIAGGMERGKTELKLLTAIHKDARNGMLSTVGEPLSYDGQE